MCSVAFFDVWLAWIWLDLMCSLVVFSSAIVCGFVDSWIGFLAKMAKKWRENLVMEIILFNTKNKRVPKIGLLRVVKRSGLRLERIFTRWISFIF